MPPATARDESFRRCAFNRGFESTGGLRTWMKIGTWKLGLRAFVFLPDFITGIHFYLINNALLSLKRKTDFSTWKLMRKWKLIVVGKLATKKFSLLVFLISVMKIKNKQCRDVIFVTEFATVDMMLRNLPGLLTMRKLSHNFSSCCRQALLRSDLLTCRHIEFRDETEKKRKSCKLSRKIFVRWCWCLAMLLPLCDSLGIVHRKYFVETGSRKEIELKDLRSCKFKRSTN